MHAPSPGEAPWCASLHLTSLWLVFSTAKSRAVVNVVTAVGSSTENSERKAQRLTDKIVESCRIMFQFICPASVQLLSPAILLIMFVLVLHRRGDVSLGGCALYEYALGLLGINASAMHYVGEDKTSGIDVALQKVSQLMFDEGTCVCWRSRSCALPALTTKPAPRVRRRLVEDRAAAPSHVARLFLLRRVLPVRLVLHHEQRWYVAVLGALPMIADATMCEQACSCGSCGLRAWVPTKTSTRRRRTASRMTRRLRPLPKPLRLASA